MSQWGAGPGNKLQRQKKGPRSSGEGKVKLRCLGEDQAEEEMLKDPGRESGTGPRPEVLGGSQ